MDLHKCHIRITHEASYQNPFPSLSIIDESREEWREEITSSEKEAIDRYVSSSFMRKVLIAAISEFGRVLTG